MRSDLIFILASVEIRLIFFVIVLVIWGIGALAKMASKTATGSPKALPPIPPGRQASAPRAARLPPLPALAKQPPPPKQKKKKASRGPLLQQQPDPQVEPIIRRLRPTSTTAQAATTNELFAGLEPKTVREQFILAEIFQPPLALRSKPRV